MMISGAAEEAPAIRFDGCSKRFGSTVVLDDFTRTIERGQRVSIIGPSGSGKTTLLRLVMTLEHPDEGTIDVFGRRLAVGGGHLAERLSRRQVAAVRRDVTMVFQHFNLFPHLTVMQNLIEAPMSVRSVERGQAEETARELLARVGLAHKETAYPRELSGGQQQRVAIARAMALNPRIVLFDEVTSALDPELVGEVLAVIRDLAAESEITMLLVTHEMRFAREISDEVLFMEAGRVVESGPPDLVLGDPQEERTRAFLRAVVTRDTDKGESRA